MIMIILFIPCYIVLFILYIFIVFQYMHHFIGFSILYFNLINFVNIKFNDLSKYYIFNYNERTNNGEIE